MYFHCGAKALQRIWKHICGQNTKQIHRYTYCTRCVLYVNIGLREYRIDSNVRERNDEKRIRQAEIQAPIHETHKARRGKARVHS